MDTAIQKAQEKMIFVTNDKEKLRAYQMRMLALSDQVSGINYARREGKIEGWIEGEIKGRIEGKEEGRFERDLELVKRQVAKGKSIEEIADILDISVTQKIIQAN